MTLKSPAVQDNRVYYNTISLVETVSTLYITCHGVKIEIHDILQL